MRYSGGDQIDNHIKHKSAIMAARSQPGDQYRLLEYYLSILGTRCLLMVSGNHENWSNQFAGVDVLKTLAKQQQIFYAPDEAWLEVEIGEQRYTVAMRHQYRMNSSFNQTHSVKQWLRHGEREFDIGCIGHHHEAAIEQTLYRRAVPLGVPAGELPDYQRVQPAIRIQPLRADDADVPSARGPAAYRRLAVGRGGGCVGASATGVGRAGVSYPAAWRSAWGRGPGRSLGGGLKLASTSPPTTTPTAASKDKRCAAEQPAPASNRRAVPSGTRPLAPRRKAIGLMLLTARGTVRGRWRAWEAVS